MGASTLRTRLRQVKEHDILVAQESPPPPTFTVPAFRARRHRGGESELLKDTYPSGFCKPPALRPLPATTKSSKASTRGQTLPWSGQQLRDLLQESKEVGVPPCGAAAGRQALNVTRVIVGAKDVVDTVGSELVQYAGFSVGPAEVSSPTSVNKSSFLSRPLFPVSPSRMTIDGSALLRGRSSLLVEARSVGDKWSRQKTCGTPGDFVTPRDESKALKGRKRIRSATADRAQSAGGPEPWPYPAEALTGRSSRPGTSASTKRRGLGGAAAASPRVNGCGEDYYYCARSGGTPLDGKEDPSRPETRDAVAKHGVGGGRDYNTQGPTCTDTDSSPTTVADQCGFKGAHENSHWSQSVQETQAGCQDETGERRDGEPKQRQMPPSEDRDQPGERRSGSGRRFDGAWAKYNDRDVPSVWSDSESDAGGGGNSSMCFIAPVGAQDGSDNDSSVVCGSSVSVANDDDGSAEQVAGKRSFSTLDTERYRGSLSKDATNILRSDIVLAVVRKKELLECDDDAGLRTLKTTAYPVHVKAGMSMAEGIRAILGSGILEDCDSIVGGGQGQGYCRWSRAGLVADGTRGTIGRPQALEYFDSQEGAWQLVRNESDWKVLLAAQSSPQGAGVIFQGGGANGGGADFLVAVTPLETQPRGRDKDNSQAAGWYRSVPGALRAALALARISKEKRVGWRYASVVTPGALRSLGPSNAERDRAGIDDRVAVGEIRKTYAAPGGDPIAPQGNAARDDGDGQATTKPGPLPGETRRETGESGEDGFRKKLAGLDGGGRRIGSGPGGALWMPTSRATVGRGAAGSPPRRPKKAKVRRLVRHLEAGLKLQGRPGAGGLPPVGSQRVDLPYTKELAKWSYDEILGIPKATVPAESPDM
eukprot:g11234.t1